MKHRNREIIIDRVANKYGYARWQVEFAADHLLGVPRARRAAPKEGRPANQRAPRRKPAT